MDDSVQPILAVPVEPAVVSGKPGADAGAGAAHARSGAETLKDLVAKECASEREAFRVAQYDLAQSRRRTAEAKRAMKQARQELERAQRKEHDLQKRVLKQRERWNSAQRDAAQKFQKEAERRQQEQARRRVEEERSRQRREDAEVRAREAREAEKSLREQAEQKAREAKQLAEAALRLHEENNALMASRRDAPSQSHAALLPSRSASSARRGKHSSKGIPRRTGLDEWGVSRAKERAKQRRQQMRGACTQLAACTRRMHTYVVT
jgi:hypothetical protein